MSDVVKRFYQVVEELHQERLAMIESNKYLQSEITRLYTWVGDLQGEMYVNCVYCGLRYGPRDKTPVAMADVLKSHIEICPHHPMSALKAENQRLVEENSVLNQKLNWRD
jgi:regulator of replication initiation timing